MKIEISKSLRTEIDTNPLLKKELSAFEERFQARDLGHAIMLYEAFDQLLSGLRDGSVTVDLSILDEELTPATDYKLWLNARRVRLMRLLGIEIPTANPVAEMATEEYVKIEIEVFHAVALAEDAIRTQAPSQHINAADFSEVVRRWNDEIEPAFEQADKAFWALLKWRGDYSEVMGTGKDLPPLPDIVRDLMETTR